MEGRLARQAEEYEVRCNDLQSQLDQSQVESKRLSAHEGELKKEVELLQDQISSLQKDISLKDELYEQKPSNSQLRLDQSQVECKRLADHEAELKKEVDLLKHQVDGLQKNISLKDQFYEQKLSECHSHLDQLQVECKRLASHEKELEKEVELLRRQIDGLRKDSSLKDQLCEQKLAECRAKCEVGPKEFLALLSMIRGIMTF